MWLEFKEMPQLAPRLPDTASGCLNLGDGEEVHDACRRHYGSLDPYGVAIRLLWAIQYEPNRGGTAPRLSLERTLL
jgi:hypothetical protein